MGEWKNYFVYTKRERQAVMLLLVITITMLAVPHIFEPPLVPVNGRLKEELIKIDAADSSMSESSSLSQVVRFDELKSPRLFQFNPNTAGMNELMRLGITEKAASVIIHYRQKGGRFKKAEDLSKIYSIRKDLYERLRPYVRIPAEEKPARQYHQKDSFRYKPSYAALNRAPPRSIEINQAAQSDWESLPGIGAKLATRILTFREKLGGFIRAEQVKETYGITDSVFDVIRPLLQCTHQSVRQIDLNSITIDELKEHPYFRGKIAYAIIRFREQHGNFKSMDDLKKLQVIDETLRQRIEPYLVIKNG